MRKTIDLSRMIARFTVSLLPVSRLSWRSTLAFLLCGTSGKLSLEGPVLANSAREMPLNASARGGNMLILRTTRSKALLPCGDVSELVSETMGRSHRPVANKTPARASPIAGRSKPISRNFFGMVAGRSSAARPLGCARRSRLRAWFVWPLTPSCASTQARPAGCNLHANGEDHSCLQLTLG